MTARKTYFDLLCHGILYIFSNNATAKPERSINNTTFDVTHDEMANKMQQYAGSFHLLD